MQRYKEDWTCKDGARGKLFYGSCLGLEQRAKGMQWSLEEIGARWGLLSGAVGVEAK